MPIQSHQKELILASASSYRRELLQRLQIPFSVQSPSVDESALKGESSSEIACRLALAKAMKVAQKYPHAVVIGSDQVAAYSGQSIGKPESVERAVKQLLMFSGQSVNFYTAICLVCLAENVLLRETDTTEVRFRTLQEAEIRRYIEQDCPLDCAGSFKSEAAGPSLMQALITSDPTAIIGLPLIKLSKLLRQAGFTLP